jgi:APA family basic amino acid/polyamine antiporter
VASGGAASAPATFVRELGVFDATMVVAGSMIGSGIFIVSAGVALQVGSPFWLVMAWAVTGALTLVAALASGELAALYPHAGGQYIYLREAFGPLTGFLYGWTLLGVIQTGTIAAVAVAFAKFLGVLVPWVSAENRLIPLFVGGGDGTVGWDLSLTSQRLVGILVIALLTYVNTRGVRTAKWVQNIFTVTKIAALALLCLIPFLGRTSPEAIAANFRSGRFFGDLPFDWGFLALFAAALIGPLFSSDAWNNIAFAGEEVKEPHRTLPRSLAMGTLLVSVLYCLANLAYLMVLPLWGVPGGAEVADRGIQYAAEERVGTAAMQVLFGQGGALLMAVFVMISTFGCENGLVLAGPRLYYAMSRDGLFFRAAGRLNRHGVPAWGLVLQGIWSALLTLSGTYGDLLDYIVFAALLFYALTVGAVFVLRRRHPELPRPYRAPGYPYLPALYVVAAAAIMLNLLVMRPRYSWPGLIIIALGILAYYIWRLFTGRRGPAQPQQR